MFNQPQRIIHLICITAMTFMTGISTPVLADDTEIYLNSSSSTGQSNILFNLDTSGSMGSIVDEDNDGITGEAGERSRIDVLKEAMNTLLDTMPALNAGIMRYHYYGGPILFPIANLATEACVIEGNCTTSTAPTGTSTITKLLSDDNDDATEADAGTMDLSSSTLDIGPRAAGAVCTDTTVSVSTVADNDAAEERNWNPATHSGGNGSISGSSDMEIPRDGGTQQLNGLWFRNVNIPADAVISSASIEFEIDEQESGEIDVDIRAVAPSNASVNSAANFGTTDGTTNPSALYVNLVGPAVEWTASDNPSAKDFITTDNIASLVTEIVKTANGWPTTTKNMVFLIEDDATNNSEDNFRTVEESTSEGTTPKLSITYQSCTGGAAILSARSGLRFQNVKIPQGAVINAASIVLTAAAADASNPTYNIHLENTDDAAAMTATAGNLAGRTYTGPVTWTGATTPAVTNPWVVDTEYPTPDLKTLVQTVVNRAGWCGGNDLLFRIERLGGDAVKRSSYSRENDSVKAPQLIINYDLTARDAGAASGSPDSCNVSTAVATISSGADDAEEHADGSMDTSSSDLEMTDDGNTQTIGLRFKNIPIVKDSTITSAKITFTADGGFSGATSLTLKGQNTGDASAFSSAANDITGTANRPRTSASVPWTTSSTPALTAWTDDITYETPDLKTIIGEIVGHADWEAGNDLALFVSGTGKRRAESFNGDSARAPVLTIEYQGSPTETKTTVRDRLKEIVDELTQRGGTPIAGSMIEAANYFRGEAVRFGMERGTQSSSDKVTRLSHAASYEANGATVTFPGACTAANLGGSDCEDQEIFGGTPKYKSPIVAECQENFLINLTDGGGYYTGSGKTNSQGVSVDEQPIINSYTAKDVDGNAVSLTNCNTNTLLSDGITSYSGSAHNECTVKLAKFLHDNDQIFNSGQTLQDSSVTVPIDGTQTVNVYTIGFNLCGGGNVTSVDSSDEQVCCAANNAQHLSTGVCSAPITDPDKIKVLKAQADVGGGEYFNANTAEELVAAFTTITGQIVSRSTSFAAPSIAVNTFNRLFSRDEIYFGLFKPEEETRWRGNVKKYNVCIDANGPDGIASNSDDCTLGEVLDDNDARAVVTDTGADDFGLFESTSTSVWTTGADVPDGREIDLGGAGAAISSFADRIIYTDQSSTGLPSVATLLNGAGFKMNSADILTSADLAHVRAEVCSTTSTPPDTDCINELLWMFGKDVDNEDNDASTTTRWWLNDVLHSSPNVITYGQDADGDFIDKLIFGTNDGALHFVNGTSGKEEWAFIPFNSFDNVPTLRTNTSSNHIYGMDGTPVLRVEDNDLDGTIESGEKLHVYTSQRRGGNSMFGLDLSVSAALTSDTALNSITPKLLWRIDGGNTGFERLGDTWSDPTVATIRTKTGSANTSRTVLIFGGGYENGLDDLDSGGVHRNFGLEGGDSGNGGLNQGNAIYIVDADTGALIFSISNAANAGLGISASTADIKVPGMFYAIPSNITVFDSDGDGFDDRLYVGDTAGNIWRVDLASDIEVGATSPEGSTLVGQLASLSTAAVGTATPTNERRIFYRPSVSQVRDTAFSNAPEGEYDAITVSTGNRAHPLDLDVSNRLYVLRDTQILPMSGSVGLATNYPQTVAVTAGVTTAQGSPILDNGSDLVNATTTALTGTTAEKNALGWYIDFDTVGAVADRTDGEKGLSATRVFFGTIFLTTYVPAADDAIADVCSANEGTGRIFNFNILTSNAALDWDGSGGSTYTKADTVQTLGAGGIPPEVVPVYTKDGVQILAGPQLIDEAGKNLAVETYWYNE